MSGDGPIAKALGGELLNAGEIETLLAKGDLLALGAAADEIRRWLHPEGVVTYVCDRNINYSNVCIAGCRFCAFFRPPGRAGGFQLGFDAIHEKIRELVEAGGTQVLMQGGLHPGLSIEYFERLFSFIKARFAVQLHSLSPPEIMHLSRMSGLDVWETLQRLHDAGLDSLPGGGAEILSNEVRSSASPGKCTADEWLEVMRTAHKLGMRTTATMMFGHLETYAHRAEHLVRIRDLQDETAGFTAFIPWSFQPLNTGLAHLPPSGGQEYLRTLAVARLALGNIDNIQASWVTQGAKVAQLALRFGANDMGSTMMEENVVRAAGVTFRLDRSGIEDLVREAGFEPQQRDTYYRPVG